MNKQLTMAESQNKAASKPEASVRVINRKLQNPLALTLLLAAIGTLLLQLWRPLFHLTDDNLTWYLPVSVEVCQDLWSGQSPFTLNSIFGGNYPLLRDATVFSLMSPYLLLMSPLANTSWFYLIPDIVGTLNLITIAGAFCWSAIQIRKRLNLPVTDGWIVFLSVSYTFTPFNLLVASSWGGFINPQASYPIVLAGLLHPESRKASGLVGGGMLYALFGGHVHPFLFLVGFGALFALFLSCTERSSRALIAFGGGGMLAVLCALPILISTFSGFSESSRGAGLDVEAASQLNVPPVQLAGSFLLGAASSPAIPGAWLNLSDPLFNTTIAFALVNVPLVWIMCRKRRFTGMEIGVLVCCGLSILLIVRPHWLAEFFTRTPIMRSLRWPFREIAVLSFFTHLLLLISLRVDSWRILRLPVALSTVFYALMFANAAPSFNPFLVDRQLLISGSAKRFWATIGKYYGPHSTIIVSAPPMALYSRVQEILPYTLLGSHNYAGLFGVVNVSGYSPTCAPTALQPDIRPVHHSGAFLPRHAELICSKNPELVHVSLTHTVPLQIEFSRGEVRHAFVFDPTSCTFSEIPVRGKEIPSEKGAER